MSSSELASPGIQACNRRHVSIKTSINWDTSNSRHKVSIRTNNNRDTSNSRHISIRKSINRDTITWSCQSVWLHNTCSLAYHWQTRLPGRLTCPMPLLYIQVQNQVRASPYLKDMSLNPLCGKNSVHCKKWKYSCWEGLTYYMPIFFMFAEIT
jgi:hypothetical protein